MGNYFFGSASDTSENTKPNSSGSCIQNSPHKTISPRHQDSSKSKEKKTNSSGSSKKDSDLVTSKKTETNLSGSSNLDCIYHKYIYKVTRDNSPYGTLSYFENGVPTCLPDVKGVLGIETTIKGGTQENQPHVKPHVKAKTCCSFVHLLNTSNVTPAKAFAEKLREDLDKVDIKTTEIKASEVSDQKYVLLMICCLPGNEIVQEVVDKFLKGIKEDQFKRIILIMLHVTRKPPHTPTRKQLMICDCPEKYRPLGKVVDMAFLTDIGIYQNNINENALDQIKSFISEYDSTPIGTEETPEVLMLPQSETRSSNQNTVTTKTNTETGCSTVHLLNTCNAKPAKAFVEELREHLYKVDIKATEIKASDVSDQAKVLLVICSQIGSEAVQTVVDKCLDRIKEDQFKRIILIMLHVTRKPPHTSTRKQLMTCDCPEKYRPLGKVVDMAFLTDIGIYQNNINENALDQIKNFISEYDSTPIGTEETPEVLMLPQSETRSSNQNTVTTKSNTETDCSTVHLLNTRNAKPAKDFVEELREHLSKVDIKTTEIKASDVSDQENVLLVICSQIGSEAVQTVVDKYLDGIKEDQYKRIILIMLHVTRKPPHTSTRKQLMSCDCPEKYRPLGQVMDMAFLTDKGIYQNKINEDAFIKIKNFISEYNSARTGTEKP